MIASLPVIRRRPFTQTAFWRTYHRTILITGGVSVGIVAGTLVAFGVFLILNPPGGVWGVGLVGVGVGLVVGYGRFWMKHG